MAMSNAYSKRLLFNIFFVFTFITSLAFANEIKLTEKDTDRQQCTGMYSAKDWGGPKGKAFIELAFEKQADFSDSEWVAIVVFEYRDWEALGASSDKHKIKYICDQNAINEKLCSEENLGTFIIPKKDSDNFKNLFAPVVSKKVNLKDPNSLVYDIQKSGYYCIGTYPSSDKVKYKVVGNMQNAFGNLPASDIPKLMFYGIFALIYGVLFAFWLFAYYQNRDDILPVQNYITAIALFLVFEMVLVWGSYDLRNSQGDTVAARIYVVITSIVNAFRNAFTFFLLLIVCHGYGVVKPRLGKTMWYCRALAGAHFLFSSVYIIVFYFINLDTDSPAIMLVALLPSVTLTIFYVWILSSLTETVRFLVSRKQNVKADMYKNLWRLLLGSMLILLGSFFVSGFIAASQSITEYIATSWKYRWFILDGWLNVIYLLDFAAIAYIWRPTANNRRFAMSDELAQDENEAHEFEIDSLRGSFDLPGENNYDEGSQRDSLDEESLVGLSQNRNSDDQESPFNTPFDDPKDKSTESKKISLVGSNSMNVGSSSDKKTEGKSISGENHNEYDSTSTITASDNQKKNHNLSDDEEANPFIVDSDEDDAFDRWDDGDRDDDSFLGHEDYESGSQRLAGKGSKKND
ncbi:hypothetical protein NADFUDRAFT_47254 [Nadsonia fulvescens var. elongata DSM 6958]|uniref:Integral membrane protein n=1 Tax=Nadsonia fulvescens var. elongata DSM 6958 TaxID=857566 RepID=A0A1E3PGV3_9ASCO|nr:hypothetical protein NADFUDRAFT_47254 [Nadsonia fulvescens var. elongata DSM 6958]